MSKHPTCGCFYDLEVGGYSTCEYHAARTCDKCRELGDTPVDGDGLCQSCADPEAECDYCKRSIPVRLMDNGAICWDCLTVNNYNEAESA